MPFTIQPNIPKKKHMNANAITQKLTVRSASPTVSPVNPASRGPAAVRAGGASPSTSRPMSLGRLRTTNSPTGRKITASAAAAKTNEKRQPTLSISCCITRKRITPSEKPVAMIPTARPRLRLNQFEIST